MGFVDTILKDIAVRGIERIVMAACRFAQLSAIPKFMDVKTVSSRRNSDQLSIDLETIWGILQMSGSLNRGIFRCPANLGDSRGGPTPGGQSHNDDQTNTFHGVF